MDFAGRFATLRSWSMKGGRSIGGGESVQGVSGAAGRGRAEVIVLIGVSGSGKSTVGRRLAPALGATFLEGDDYHPSANIAKMRSGQALTDADRAPWLDKLGQAIAAHSRPGRPVVVACSALRRAYRDRLAKAARQPLTFVHLTIAPSVLESRIKARRSHFMPAALLESQLKTLEPLGAGEDGTEITETGTFQQTIEAIRRWMKLRRDGRLHGQHENGRHEKGRHRRPFLREHLPGTMPGRSLR